MGPILLVDRISKTYGGSKQRRPFDFGHQTMHRLFHAWYFCLSIRAAAYVVWSLSIFRALGKSKLRSICLTSIVIRSATMVQLSSTFSAFAGILALTAPAFAHPHGSPEELAKREVYQRHTGRAFSETCLSKMKARDHHSRAAQRRADFARRMREARGITLDTPYRRMAKRQLATVEESHLSNQTGLTADSDPFTDESSGCVLDPEVTQGPYRAFSWFVCGLNPADDAAL